MQCPTLDESLTSQPVAPAGAATCAGGLQGWTEPLFRVSVTRRHVEVIDAAIDGLSNV